MTAFVFTETVPAEKIESAALGVDNTHKLATADVGKAVKLSTANNFVLCSGGDEIDGFVNSVDAFTVNDGFSFGGVLREGRVVAMVGSNQSGSMAVGDYVVADTQVTLGTAGYAKVKSGTAASQLGSGAYTYTAATPSRNLWRCIRLIEGSGAVGKLVLLERL